MVKYISKIMKIEKNINCKVFIFYLFTSHTLCARNSRYTLKECTWNVCSITSSDNPWDAKSTAHCQGAEGILTTSKLQCGGRASRVSQFWSYRPTHNIHKPQTTDLSTSYRPIHNIHRPQTTDLSTSHETLACYVWTPWKQIPALN